MSLLLIITGPEGQKQECNLAAVKLPVSFGREGGGADMQVTDTQMSRKHCEIFKEDDEFIIKDLNSSNGTWINGTDRQQAILQDGDMINVGGSSMEVMRLENKQDDPLLGRDLNGFLVQAVIGSGSQAKVFRGTQVNLDRAVAMKIMRGDSQSKSQIENFVKEAREAGRLNHPNVVQVHDVFNVGDLYVLIMELMEGESTLHQLQKDGPFDYEEGLKVLMHMADAIAYAQANKIVHRDIKPANILQTNNGIYKLADLGIATRLRKGVAQDGRMHGTPLYMSPEQARGDKIDTRADIYCLGASIWHLITGAPVFTGSPREVIGAHMHRDVPDLKEAAPGLNPGLADLITSMLAKNPNERPINGQELAVLAGGYVGQADLGEPATANGNGSRRRGSRGRGRRRPATAGSRKSGGARRRSRRRR